MIIPFRTDEPTRRRPAVTEGLIFVNLLVYLAGLTGRVMGAFDAEAFISWGHFDPQHFRAWQLITTQFMHDPYGPWHIAFNMLFLWVFGAAVEDRLGHAAFLGFYLVGGAVAALGHMMVSQAPIIGASGSIAAGGGAFLAFCPRSKIIVLFLLGGAVMAVPSLWFIGLYFTIDVLNQFVGFLGRDRGNVAYMAHIVGYLYGFGTAFVLLAIGYVPRRDCDVFYLFKQARRRAALRAANRDTPAGAWESAMADTGTRLQKKIEASAPPTEAQQRIAKMRSEVNTRAAAHDLAGAAEVYRNLLTEAPDSAFNEQRQVDLANQFFVEHDHAHAAAAYELLLDRYPAHSGAAQVRLMLGLMYARHLQRPERAREVIDAARTSLRDPGQTALADALLAELHG